MTAATHYAFSYLLTSAAGFDQQTALVSSIASLLPDIDHPESLVGRLLPGVSRHIQKKYGHRTVTHSVFAVLLLLLVLSPLLYFFPRFYGAIILAYSSHIFIDLFNRSGVRLFSPVSTKEYISFRTPEFRVLVSSWQEYLVFFVIVFMSFSVSGEAFSFTRAVRSVSKLFYRHYDGALVDYQEASSHLCYADVTYFDNIERRKVKERFVVLNLFPNEAFLLKDNRRYILNRDDILEIEVIKSVSRVSPAPLAGSDLSLLNSLPAGSFVSGSVTVKSYCPDIRNTPFIIVKKSTTDTIITLRFANPHEMTPIIAIERERSAEIESLRRKLSASQIASLRHAEDRISRRISYLSKRGLYSHYSEVTRLSGELKRIQTKIDSLELNAAAGGDIPIQEKIDRLSGSFSVQYSLRYYKI